MAWPGWGLLPQLVTEAGATPVPVAAEDLAASGRTIVLSRPNDPTGAVIAARRAWQASRGDAWLILDEALSGFLPDGEDGLVEHPRVIHVRSFSKAHAMAGFRVGYAVLPEGAEDLAPRPGARRRRRGRSPAPCGRSRTARTPPAAGARSPPPSARGSRRRWPARRSRLAPGHGPYVWLEAPDGPALAEALAARRIFVAPGTAWGDERHVRITLARRGRDGSARGCAPRGRVALRGEQRHQGRWSTTPAAVKWSLVRA